MFQGTLFLLGRTSLMELLDQFRTLYPGFGLLPSKHIEDGFTLGPDDVETSISIVQDGEEYTVHVHEAHAHFESAEEALTVVKRVLDETIRVGQEFRGDARSATWFEYQDPDGNYSVKNLTLYLSPFDLEDWKLMPGEEWRQIRKTRSFDPLSGITSSEFEIIAEQSIHSDHSMMTWLSDGLGPPQPEMRWIVSGHNRHVLQAPSGWRRVVADENQEFHDYAPHHEGFVYRVSTYFREAEEAIPFIGGAATRPTKIEDGPDESHGDWLCQSWSVFFTDGETDMLGMIYLYFLPRLRVEASILIERIEAALPKFLMAPDNWDCKTIR